MDTEKKVKLSDGEIPPEGYILVPMRSLVIAKAILGYIAFALTVLAVFVGLSLGTNNDQNNRIENLVNAQRQSSLIGCKQNNRLREQSNRRIPAEKIELKTAILVSSIAHKFHLEGAESLASPKEIQDLLEGLEEVPVRNCEEVYGASGAEK